MPTLDQPVLTPQGASPPPLPAVLRVSHPDRPERRVPLDSGKCTIGSSPRCRVCLPASDARPMQCVLSLEAGVATVTRWAAGVLLNGHDFSAAPFDADDRLTIGSWELMLELAAAPPVRPSAEPTAEQPALDPAPSPGAAAPESGEFDVTPESPSFFRWSEPAQLLLPAPAEEAPHDAAEGVGAAELRQVEQGIAELMAEPTGPAPAPRPAAVTMPVASRMTIAVEPTTAAETPAAEAEAGAAEADGGAAAADLGEAEACDPAADAWDAAACEAAASEPVAPAADAPSETPNAPPRQCVASQTSADRLVAHLWTANFHARRRLAALLAATRASRLEAAAATATVDDLTHSAERLRIDHDAAAAQWAVKLQSLEFDLAARVDECQRLEQQLLEASRRSGDAEAIAQQLADLTDEHEAANRALDQLRDDAAERDQRLRQLADERAADDAARGELTANLRDEQQRVQQLVDQIERIEREHADALAAVSAERDELRTALVNLQAAIEAAQASGEAACDVAPLADVYQNDGGPLAAAGEFTELPAPEPWHESADEPVADAAEGGWAEPCESPVVGLPPEAEPPLAPQPLDWTDEPLPAPAPWDAAESAQDDRPWEAPSACDAASASEPNAWDAVCESARDAEPPVADDLAAPAGAWGVTALADGTGLSEPLPAEPMPEQRSAWWTEGPDAAVESDPVCVVEPSEPAAPDDGAPLATANDSYDDPREDLFAPAEQCEVEPVEDFPAAAAEPASVPAPLTADAAPESYIERYQHLLDNYGDAEEPAAPTAPRMLLDEEYMSPRQTRSRQPADDDSDEALEAYMSNLMRRVRGDESDAPPSTRGSMLTPTPVAPAAPPQPEEPREPFSLEAMKAARRGHVQPLDLSALRAIANDSARQAIADHKQRRHAESMTSRGILLAITAGASAYALYTAPGVESRWFWAGAAAAFAAGGLAIQLIVQLRRRAGVVSNERLALDAARGEAVDFSALESPGPLAAEAI